MISWRWSVATAASPSRSNEVGRQVQAILERGIGARLGSGRLRRARLEGPLIAHELAIIYAIEDARLVAMLKDKIVRAIGITGSRFLAEVLTGRQTFAQYADARGKGGERGTAYIAEHFRILLEDLDTEFAAVGVLQAIRAFQGEPTGEETDSRGRTVSGWAGRLLRGVAGAVCPRRPSRRFGEQSLDAGECGIWCLHGTASQSENT